MRWGPRRFAGKANQREGGLRDREKNKTDISFKLAGQILKHQSRIAAYLNAWASGKSAKQMRIMLVCFLVAAGGYCLYLICASLAVIVK